MSIPCLSRNCFVWLVCSMIMSTSPLLTFFSRFPSSSSSDSACTYLSTLSLAFLDNCSFVCQTIVVECSSELPCLPLFTVMLQTSSVLIIPLLPMPILAFLRPLFNHGCGV